MKNGKLVSAYFDYCAETIRLGRLGTTEGAEAQLEATRLWQACLDDGWTAAELDAAYERRARNKGATP